MTPELIPATIDLYPTIQNMGRFYTYDMSRSCGFISEDWGCPSNGLYESFDLKPYFEDVNKHAFLIKVERQLAGFVMIDKDVAFPGAEWNMGEFFIVAKFQGKGIGMQVTTQILTMFPGLWEVSVIPENKPALHFWRKAINRFTKGQYTEEIKSVDYDSLQPNRYFLRFHSLPESVQSHAPVEIVESTKEEQQFVDDQIVAFNRTCVPFTQDDVVVPMSYVIKDAQGDIMAGINACMYCWQILYVDVLFVHEQYRHQGLGAQLLSKAEEEAKTKGSTLAHLDTLDWQAKDFYIKMGYEVFGILDDCPPSHKRYYLKKNLGL